MAEYNLKSQEVNFEEITLNEHGDKAVITADDPTLFDRFTAGYKHIAEMADSIPAKLEEIEKQYEGKEDFSDVMAKTVEMSRVNVNFSEETVAIIDGIFGEGTVKKRFRDAYEKIPHFLPDADLFIGFLEGVTPVMEKVFNRKMERQEKASKARMAKYQPQDHRRKQIRNTVTGVNSNHPNPCTNINIDGADVTVGSEQK